MPHERRAIIPGRFVSEDKRQFARQLRREMTSQERKLWEAVRDRRLGGFKFRRQQPIDGYVADFYCDQAGVVIELDGVIHEDQAEYDAHRDRVMAARELVVIRLPNARIETDFDQVLAEILVACRRASGS